MLKLSITISKNNFYLFYAVENDDWTHFQFKDKDYLTITSANHEVVQTAKEYFLKKFKLNELNNYKLKIAYAEEGIKHLNLILKHFFNDNCVDLKITDIDIEKNYIFENKTTEYYELKDDFYEKSMDIDYKSEFLNLKIRNLTNLNKSLINENNSILTKINSFTELIFHYIFERFFEQIIEDLDKKNDKTIIENFVNLCQSGADLGNSAAQNKLGMLYQYGYFLKQSFTDALKWYQKAVKQGNIQAQNNLAWLYKNGLGTLENLPKAIELYKSSAKQGSCDANYMLGVIFENGHIIEQNYYNTLEKK